MPAEAINFRHGYQWDNQLFLMEQTSDYYRRHLLLHEGTHWFLWKFLGGNGAPWFSEGICELLGTHHWQDQVLKLGVIPDHRDRFPYWGRLKLIQDALANESAPTLGAILGYNDTAHRTDEPYAWSWAAMLFFTNHPKYRESLQQVVNPPLGYSNQISVDLKETLKPIWPIVDAEWRTFVSDLDFGYSPEHSLPDFESPSIRPLRGAETLSIRTDRGWQSTGLMVDKDQSLRIEAKGAYTIRVPSGQRNEATWKCEPHGITIQYYQGQPLGRLVATVVPLSDHSAGEPMRRRAVLPIGRSATWRPQESGLLLLKINEASAGLSDNLGELTVSISRDAS